jgi:hypothetical protein
MIPDIGVMIGAYIFTKMFSLLTRKESKESVATKIFAVITILITIFIVLDLLLSGAPKV